MEKKDESSSGMEEIKEEGQVMKGEKSKDKQYSSSRQFDDDSSAKAEFSTCKQKLFDVNAWSSIPAITNSNFKLHSGTGEVTTRTRVEKGDFIEIDLPGPLPFYWVKVNEVKEGEDEAEFTVQPSHNPKDKTHKEGKVVTDHFFQEHARSIFRVERRGSEITAMEIGINEAVNTGRPEAGEKGLVNKLVSEGGWAAFQKYQWKNLTDYLVGIS